MFYINLVAIVLSLLNGSNSVKLEPTHSVGPVMELAKN